MGEQSYENTRNFLFFFDSQGNNEHNFDLKIQKLETNLDMWKARDLTLFGKVFIILRCSQLLTRIVPREVVRNVQGRLFNFFMEQKKRDRLEGQGYIKSMKTVDCTWLILNL